MVKNWLKQKYRKFFNKLECLKDTPRHIADGCATGIAVSFTPFVGFHLLIALGIAKISKQNTFAAALGTLAGNPWTFPFIWYATLHTGNIILKNNQSSDNIDFMQLFKELYHAIIMLDFTAFSHDIWPIFLPMLIGSILFGVVVWVVSAGFITIMLTNRKLKERK